MLGFLKDCGIVYGIIFAIIGALVLSSIAPLALIAITAAIIGVDYYKLQRS